MLKNNFFIGLDIACDDFVATIYQDPSTPTITKEGFLNNFDGYSLFTSWLKDYNIDQSNCIICMEATGVYSESIAYYLATHKYKVSVEPPLKVKRAFDPIGHKTDPVDSIQIAEYAYRYIDELKFWSPKEELIEKIKHLLTAREQFTKQSVSIQNAMKAYEKHVIQVPLIVNAHRDSLKEIKKHISNIDKELNRIIKQNPKIHNINNTLKSIPGFGLLLASNLIAITEAFDTGTNYKTIAAYIGICPYKHQSGKSVYRQAHMRTFGPTITRKLLTLAARSVVTHNNSFKQYYHRKLAEGKDKKLVLNNVANKLIKIACALVKNNLNYSNTYKSINPMLLKVA